MPGEIASARVVRAGPQVQSQIQLGRGTDPRVLVLLAHHLLRAAEQKGVLTTSVAQARLLLEGQVNEWGLSAGPSLLPKD